MLNFLKYLKEINLKIIDESYQKRKIERENKLLFETLAKEKKILDGIFKGMIYPTFKSFGSSIYPKIIGTYEYELQIIFKDLIKKKYKTIIDIGCAEGYYAVGLKKAIPSAKIIAVDINPKARNFCIEMAKLNNVYNDFQVLDQMNEDLLLSSLDENTLIICDCEGCEIELFTKKNIAEFVKCDLIIETHDMINNSISTTLTNLFSKTHNVQIIQSIDDNLKAKYYNSVFLEGLDISIRKYLTRENRPQIMEWLICIKK